MTNAVSTNGVTANIMFFDRGTFWVLPLTYLYHPKSARAYLFPQSVKTHYFCRRPISADPICPQPKRLFLRFYHCCCYYYLIIIIIINIIVIVVLLLIIVLRLFLRFYAAVTVGRGFQTLVRSPCIHRLEAAIIILILVMITIMMMIIIIVMILLLLLLVIMITTMITI